MAAAYSTQTVNVNFFASWVGVGARFFVLGAALFAPLAQAAPRVGSHDGFTRLVFDLPHSGNGQASRVQISKQGSLYRLQLGQRLPNQSGTLSAAGVSGYQVSGNQITLRLTRQGTPHAQLLGQGQPRLVIDIPTTGRPLGTAAASNKAAVVRPVVSRVQPTVVIDPGHGGVDPGMRSQWVTEKEVTLDIALKVRARLQQRGIKVIMTRDHDTQISVDKTTDLEARSRMAQNDKVNAYVSIHVNAGGPGAQGIETYYFGAPLSGSKRSLAVAENGGGDVGQKLTARAANTAQSMLGDLVSQAKLSFSRSLAAQVQRNLVADTGAFNRGVLSDAFYVIRNPTTAAILVEVGFGSSPVEGPKLAMASYRDRLAGSIADSIASFLHK